MRLFKFVGGLFFCIGLLILVSAGFVKAEQRAFYDSSIEADGKVVDDLVQNGGGPAGLYIMP